MTSRMFYVYLKMAIEEFERNVSGYNSAEDIEFYEKVKEYLKENWDD